jgi:hypothetical protein
MAESCWPTKNQELLLRACLLDSHEALIAWRHWQAIFEAGSFDEGSRRLLPLLYRNLKAREAAGPLIARLKEEYFYTWSQNQFCLRGIASLIGELNQSGIQNMLLKGSALALLYYEDLGLRPMKDIDLMVCLEQAKRSMQLLTSLGWKPRYASPEALIPFEQATEFIDANNQNVDLHWRLMWEGRQDLDDDEFWQASIPMHLNGIETRSLSPADQLLHVCVHGAKWNDTSPLRWIADAMMIIRSRKLKIDWTRLVHQAQERQLTLPMRETLSYLNGSFEAGIPTEVLTQLEGAPISRLERWSYRVRLGGNDSLKMSAVVWHWVNSLWVNCEGTLPQRLIQFSQYLQSLWSITSAWQIPLYVVVKPIKRVYSTIKLNLRSDSASESQN